MRERARVFVALAWDVYMRVDFILFNRSPISFGPYHNTFPGLFIFSFTILISFSLCVCVCCANVDDDDDDDNEDDDDGWFVVSKMKKKNYTVQSCVLHFPCCCWIWTVRAQGEPKKANDRERKKQHFILISKHNIFMKVFPTFHSPFDQRAFVTVLLLFTDFNTTSVILSVSNIPVLLIKITISKCQHIQNAAHTENANLYVRIWREREINRWLLRTIVVGCVFTVAAAVLRSVLLFHFLLASQHSPLIILVNRKIRHTNFFFI